MTITLNTKLMAVSVLALASIHIVNAQSKLVRQASSFAKAMEDKQVRPNIILIMADDMGWGDMSYNGNPVQKTPHLDQMVNEGVRFDRFYSAAAVCAPTRASVMTGSTPLRVDMIRATTGHIRSHLELLPEYFRDRGYTTGHFGKWHLGTLSRDPVDFPDQGRDPVKDYSPPWENGFDVCFSTHNVVPTWNPMDVPNQGGNWHCQRRSDEGWWGQHYFDETGNMFLPEDPMLKGDDSRILMDRALLFIESRAKADRPFLAVIWFHAPHTPTLAGGAFLDMYEGREGRHHYGSISAMDAQIGRLRSHLANLRIYENTLIWFCSDNGAARHNPDFGEYGGYGSNGTLRDWKGSYYEGGIRVPGILVFPQQFTKRVISAPVCTSDIYPTLEDFVWGEKPTQPEDGISILPMLTGRQTARGSTIAFGTDNRHRVILDDRYKLHRFEHAGVPRWELYDLVDDPGEQDNLFNERPEVVERLKTQYDEWLRSCEKSLKQLNSMRTDSKSEIGKPLV